LLELGSNPLWENSAAGFTLSGMPIASPTAVSTNNKTLAPAPAAGGRVWVLLRSTFGLAIVGCVLLWMALPPVGLGLLAWIAPIPLVMLVRRRELVGRRPYTAIWAAGFVFWLAALYWLTLPHWATSVGWLAISFYLALYLPLFVGLSRVAVHTLGVSPILAAPVVWTGLELCRAYLLSGFAMASLAHTQVRFPIVLQISDLFGGYGVCFLIVLVAACAARMLPIDETPRAWWPVVPACVALAAAFAYGQWRLQQQTTEPGPKVALIQGSIDIEMKHDPTQAQRIFDEYFALTQQAVKEHEDLDLIVWPETMFRYPWFTFDKDFRPPADARWTTAEAEASSRRAVENTVAPIGTPFLLGIETVHEKPSGMERFNSALLTDGQGQMLDRYDKCLRVAFGEYVPLADTFPWLYNLTPLPSGLNAGVGPKSFDVGDGHFASANICYENTIPHLVRSQVVQLAAEGREPDVLVNLTNDGWFWGSSELDMHLACAVFRAIECRKPFLVAANTGFSAWIDSNGRIVEQGRRRATDVIVAETQIDLRKSPYLLFGDLPAGICLVACGLLAVTGARRRRLDRKKRLTPTA